MAQLETMPSSGALPRARPTQRLMNYLQYERRDLWVVVIYSVAIGLTSLAVPVAVQAVVNTVQFGQILQPLVVLAVLVLVALGFNAVLRALRSWVLELIQQRIFVRLAGDVAHRLVRVQVQAFDRAHGPELVNRFLDVVTVQKASSQLVIDGLELVMQTLLGMLLLAAYHPFLLAFDVVLLVLMVGILFGLGGGAVRTSIKESGMKYEIVAWLEEMARHLTTFKTPAGAQFGLTRTDELVTKYLGYRSKHFSILLRQIVGLLALQAIASAVLLGAGGWLVIQRQLTLGQLIAAEIVVSLIVASLAKFGKQLETFYDLQAALDKLGYLSDLPQERQGGEPVPRGERGARIELTQVSMSVPGRESLLRDLDLAIASEDRVGMSGASGEGKSILLDVVYGVRQPDAGVLTLDGRHYRDLDLSSLRGQIALVRDNEVFMGTVADNVRLGSPQSKLDDVREALEAVGLLRVCMALPDGLQTQLSTGGWPLTPSQVTRLMIARAICGRPRLLLIDEVLDPMDPLDRAELLNLLFARGTGWSVLIVSSEPSVLQRCNRVYRLQDGHLVEVVEGGRRG